MKISVAGIAFMLLALHTSKSEGDPNNYDGYNDECRGKIDIVFLIDNSWSVLKPNFDKLKDFITTTAYDLRPLSQEHVLVGVDVFSKKAVTEISLKGCNDFWSFRKAVSQIPFQGGPTNTHCALDNALWNSFSEEYGGRPYVPKLAIIFTDGKSQDKKATWEAAYRLKDSGVNVVAIGIGPHIDEEELVAISSDGNPYKLPNFGMRAYNHRTTSRIFSIFIFHIYIVEKGKLNIASVMLTPYTTTLFLLLIAIIIGIIDGQLKKIDAKPKKPFIALINNKCGGKRDMVFLLDSSGSVTLQNFKTMLNTAANIAHHFQIGSQHTQVGVDRFSTTAKTMIKLNQWNNWFALQMKIKQIPYVPGLTYTWIALDHARTESFSESYGARPGVPKIAIVMTDGKSQNKTKTCEAAKRLRNSGVNVFAIGIGINIDWSEILCITIDSFSIRVNNFAALKSKSFRKRIANEACSLNTIIIPTRG
ncbi:collagen alpha-1(XII) chain-like [Mytilus californianus]|uniref:collagen alpha-1(XII) chain-like n=1 Tax=Mytilus californianus TaxID=6549 RepID=UPI002247540E|nr:collagen alpha-1(XII) chain-like [Mytilus californianus]